MNGPGIKRLTLALSEGEKLIVRHGGESFIFFYQRRGGGHRFFFDAPKSYQFTRENAIRKEPREAAGGGEAA